MQVIIYWVAKITNLDMEYSALANEDDTGLEDDDDDNFLGDGLEWYQWNTIGYDGGVSGTPMNDDYNLIYRLKPRVK